MPDQYDKEEDLFRAAVRLGTPAERQAYIQDVCRDDPALRSRLSSLLAAHSAEHRVLDALMPEHDVGIDGAVVAEGPGTVIGRYKLLERIGEGGMAVVYMAEQQEPIRRKVALKIIKLGMDTKQVIARFEAERQALALMDHPCIAKVLDAGATETGRPYFVMELVQGIAITDYSDRNRLSTRERLKLFIQVCEAVQHAHQKGIIHRDIKPSNVMVTMRDGMAVPKVIDFGIAKATQQRLTEKTLFTRYAHIIGTPAYMSPEQAELSEFDVDTRSDIYSLGVLLYQLLTGTTPFSEEELRQAGYVGMQRMIREEEPTKPSTKLSTLGQTLTDVAKFHGSTPDLLKKAIRGDLDWIVMKSLEKDRRQRYETANALALDVERHLKNEPVTARPPSAAYRLRKFVRRNTVTVTAGVTVGTVLVLGICLSTWQALRATRAESVAEKAKTLSERQHYAASIALAQNLIDQGQYDQARQILAQPSLASLRGWEWGWLERACHRDLITLTSGEAALTGVDFSPDGRIIATGCLDGTACLWDVTTGRKIATLEVGQSFVPSARFGPDGRLLATPNFDGTIKVWDVVSRQVLFTLLGHTDWVYSAVFSPDGKRIATASRDRTVRLWDAKDGTLLRTVAEYGDSVMCVAFSPDGKRLAYAGGSSDPFVSGLDTTVRVLDLESGQTRVLTGHSNSVTDIAFSSDGTYLVTASWDGTARVADMRSETGLRPLFTGPEQSGFWSVAFSPDNRSCALGGGTSQIDARVYLIDMKTEKATQVCEGHSRMVRGVTFSPDGTRIVTTSFDGTAKVWPVPSLPESLSLEGHQQAVWTVVVSPDGRRVATGGLDQTAKIWDIETGNLLLTLPVNFPVVSLAFGPDGKRLVTVAPGCTAKVWDLGRVNREDVAVTSASEAMLTLAGHSGVVMCVAYGPQGHWVATGGKDNTARIWDARSGRLVRTLTGHNGWVLAAAFCPDGTRLATASTDGTARVWNVGTGHSVLTLHGRPNQGAQASWDWDTSGSWPSTARPDTNWIIQVAWSPDGKIIATGGADGTARLWDAATGAALSPPLRGHRDGVSSLAFSPDDRRLATAGGGMQIQQPYGRDFTVHLWDVSTGQNLLRFRAHDNVVRAVTFSADGMRLITASVDHTARVHAAFPWRTADYPGDAATTVEERLAGYKGQYWAQNLASHNHGTIPDIESGRRVEERTVGEYVVASERTMRTRPSHPIPVRDSGAKPNQADLSEIYNAALNEMWQPMDSLDILGQDLSAFPSGLREWDGVLFDVRSVIQLGSAHPDWAHFPQRVQIPVSRHFRRLHVLHSTAHPEREGLAVGAYVLHYADGKEQRIEILYGRDVRDWWTGRDPKPTAVRSKVVWTAPSSSASSPAETIRIFKTTYANPRPEVTVVRVDFISRSTQSAPFLLAMTIE